MKKRLVFWISFLLAAFLLYTPESHATKVYSLSDDFSTDPGTNWGFNSACGGTMTYSSANKLMAFRWSTSATATKTLSASVLPGNDNKVTVETIVKFYTSGNSSSSGCLYFLDSNKKPITGIWFGRSSSQWRIARATTCAFIETVPTAGATTANVLASDAPTAKITAVLDFSTHTLDYSAVLGTYDYTTKAFTAGTTTATATAQAFIDATATDVKHFMMNYFKSSSLTGTNGFDMMFAGVSSEQTVATADVTVKFKDQNNESFKPDEIQSAQVVGSTYNATVVQKTTFKSADGNFYYVLDPASATSAVVDNAGSTLTLQFRKASFVSSMTWNGTVGTNANLWSEWYQNFMNGGSATAYNKEANATFDGSASNKTVLINDNINLGAGNVYVTAPGYKLTGSGSLVGTGALNSSITGTDTLTLDVLNSLTGRTQLAGGVVLANKIGSLGAAIDINGPSNLLINAGTLPATTFNASTTINAGALNTTIAGMTAGSGVKISVVDGYNTPTGGTPAFLFAASGTLSAGSELEFNGTGTENKFGMTSVSTSYLANTKVTLKGKSYLFIDAAQSAATTINVGSLAGEVGSKIGWAKSSDLTRDITWSVGALNESTTYAGTITNIGAYQGSGNMYTGNNIHLQKVGTGTLTLSGTANTHNGNFVVAGGELKITGQIGKSSSIFNVTSGTLSVMNGGTLTASALNLTAGTFLVVDSASKVLATNVNMPINGSSIAKLTLPDNTVLTTLTVTATAAPALGTTYSLIQAKHPATISFTNAPILPAGFTYNSATGELTYIGTILAANTNISAAPTPMSGGTLVVPAGIELTIDRDTTIAYSILVAPGGKITLADGKAFIGNVTLQSDASGSATLLNKTGNLSGATIIAKQNVTGFRDWYMSSPVNNGLSSAFQASIPANQVVSYDEVNNTWPRLTNDSTKLINAKGYIVHLPGAGNVSFSGTPNDGSKSIFLTKTTGNFAGFNLVGNPYPSYLNWQSAATANPMVSSTIWYRAKTKGNVSVFATYNATGDIATDNGSGVISKLIPPMQGFWVLASDTTRLNLTNDMRSHADVKGNLLKSASVSNPVIRLRVSNGASFDETVLYARQDASDAFDRFDSPKMFSGNADIPEICSTIGDQKLVINGMNCFKPGMEIPVALTSGNAGTFSLQASELTDLDGDMQVILKDKRLNKRVDLTEGNVYTFSTETVSNSNRFSILIASANAPTALQKNENESSILVFRNNSNRIEVVGGKAFEHATVTVFNIIGKRLAEQFITDGRVEFSNNLTSGIYVVQITNGGKSISKKVMVE